MDIVIRKAEKTDLAGILSLYGQLETDNSAVLDMKTAGSNRSGLKYMDTVSTPK